MTQETKQHIVEKYIEAYNTYDTDSLPDYLDAEVEFKHMTGNKVESSTKGIEAFKELAGQMKEVFASRTQVITAYSEKGDIAYVEFDYEAILAIDLPNGLKAGEKLALKGRSELTFLGDKIIQIFDFS